MYLDNILISSYILINYKLEIVKTNYTGKEGKKQLYKI